MQLIVENSLKSLLVSVLENFSIGGDLSDRPNKTEKCDRPNSITNTKKGGKLPP
ncbi:hypothetical protein [Nostoc sp. LEGE 06077]|uniref:hypothetical protein n=1 Tax=Nostoc sp. LEGE 06077 TaxID=915325 RepID=UPI001880E2E8|nr:hypothetical protein [Nostoc sp. LEGE 06077]